MAGDLALARSLCDDPAWWREHLLSDVLANGRLPFVQWTLQGMPCPDTEEAMACAALSGSTDVLQWGVEEQGWPLTSAALVHAVGRGHMDAVRWMVERGCPRGDWSAQEAATGGHTRILAYLLAAGAPLAPRLLTSAARGGHVDTAAFLLARGCPYSATEVAEAACLAPDGTFFRWWLAEGHAWDPPTCAAKAVDYPGNIEVAVTVSEASGILHDAFLALATRARDVDALRYWHRHGTGSTQLSAAELEIFITDAATGSFFS